jgi:hypothetical protein
VIRFQSSPTIDLVLSCGYTVRTCAGVQPAKACSDLDSVRNSIYRTAGVTVANCAPYGRDATCAAGKGDRGGIAE